MISINSQLLIDGPTIPVSLSLAASIGLNEAIVLQQIHYWLYNKENAGNGYFNGRFWVHNTYEQWQMQFPFWSISTIRRTIGKLEEMGLLLIGNFNKVGFDKTKWYTINYEVLGNLFNDANTSAQNEQTICSICADRADQNEQTNTIDYTKNNKAYMLNVLNDSASQAPPSNRRDFDYTILEKQIKKTCSELEIVDYEPYLDIISYFCRTFHQVFGKAHPNISHDAMVSVVRKIRDGTDLLLNPFDVDCYHDMIDQYFDSKYDDCDYHISHFMTDGIRDICFYKACY